MSVLKLSAQPDLSAQSDLTAQPDLSARPNFAPHSADRTAVEGTAPRYPEAVPPGGRGGVIELEVRPGAGPAWLDEPPLADGAGSGLGPAPATLTVRLPAETVRFDGPHLVFLSGDELVRTVPRADVASLTWRGAESRRRSPSSRHPNAGALWTDEERAALTTAVLGDQTWVEISRRHGRTVTAVRREAVKARLVDELGRRIDPPPTERLRTTPNGAHS